MDKNFTSLIKTSNICFLFFLTGILTYLFVAWSYINMDIASFLVFILMCYSGFIALNTAKDIITNIEENKKYNYNKLKSSMKLIDSASDKVKPIGFKNSKSFSKYATSIYYKNLDLAS